MRTGVDRVLAENTDQRAGPLRFWARLKQAIFENPFEQFIAFGLTPQPSADKVRQIG